ncbi:hypothetical protein [Streptomyces avicenniae]|uniref:hypothetical protein n=1 Tax=Streptomyces avicenniae TaxID=500153 RepID=UPI00069BC09F|nr:hypothetical protein [Streptomyces avicenniae]
MDFDKVKLDGDQAAAVRSILLEAYQDMATTSTRLGGLSDTVHTAIRGAGTAQAQENYSALGKSGQVLSEILETLETDFGIVITEAEELDIDAQGVVNGVSIQTITPDGAIAGGI